MHSSPLADPSVPVRRFSRIRWIADPVHAAHDCTI
jgi:hypothetical protein